MTSVRIIGIDPGLRRMGWGVIESKNNHLKFVASGTIQTDSALSVALRLQQLYESLTKIIQEYQPQEAAIEYVFVNKDAKSTLKLGHARAICLLVPAQFKLVIAEYSPNTIKKSVIGVGHGTKEQISHMVKLLIPKVQFDKHDAADALAIAICHAHHRVGENRLKQQLLGYKG